MAVVVAVLGIIGALAIVGAADLLAKAIRALTAQVWLLAKAQQQSVVIASQQIEMNRQLVEAVKNRPPVVAFVSTDPATTKH